MRAWKRGYSLLHRRTRRRRALLRAGLSAGSKSEPHANLHHGENRRTCAFAKNVPLGEVLIFFFFPLDYFRRSWRHDIVVRGYMQVLSRATSHSGLRLGAVNSVWLALRVVRKTVICMRLTGDPLTLPRNLIYFGEVMPTEK